jgi:hypothetical protein
MKRLERLTRRLTSRGGIIVGSAMVVLTLWSMTAAHSTATAEPNGDTIRPFKFQASDEALGDLGRRIRSKPMSTVAQPMAGDETTVRPFRVNVPEAKLVALRTRIKCDKLARAGNGHGCLARRALATMQELARYWATDYDWRKCAAKLNALPQFITEIDGLDIHFIHVRSNHENALPLIVTHGWPGSIIEQLKIRAGFRTLRT